jgi:hypothetical protein
MNYMVSVRHDGKDLYGKSTAVRADSILTQGG